MEFDEIYKNILCLFNKNRYNDYIESLSYIYNRFYNLLKIVDDELAEKVLSYSKNILTYITNENSRNELFIEDIHLPTDIIKYKDVFFRARTVESAPKESYFKAQNMFHLSLRETNTQPGRYNEGGKTRLYLSKSCFSCFNEVSQTEGKSMIISLFNFNHTTPSQIVDFRLKSELAFNKLELKIKRDYLLSLPYILACMFINKGHLEYIFPQYVMSVLDYMDERLQKKHNGIINNVFTPYIGLSYTSVYFDDELIRRENNEHLYDNYVFLAKYGKENTGTSKLLSNMFTVTDPLRCQWNQKSDYKEIEENLKKKELFMIQ